MDDRYEVTWDVEGERYQLTDNLWCEVLIVDGFTMDELDALAAWFNGDDERLADVAPLVARLPRAVRL